MGDGFGNRLFDEFAKAFVSFQLVCTHNRSVKTRATITVRSGKPLLFGRGRRAHLWLCIVGPHGDGIAHLLQLKQFRAMNDARTRLIHLHRDVRQITWMVAATIVLELVLLVKIFWGQ